MLGKSRQLYSSQPSQCFSASDAKQKAINLRWLDAPNVLLAPPANVLCLSPLLKPQKKKNIVAHRVLVNMPINSNW